MNRLLLYFLEAEAPAKRLAHALDVEAAPIEIHHFPDGESLVTLPETMPESVLIYQSLNRPNEKLVELLLAAGGARKLGARKIVFIAPYLAYMRQDKAFCPGQVVSQEVMGHFLSGLFDAILTVDAHLHRVRDIESVFPDSKAINLTSAELTAEFIKENYPADPLLLGPDEESLQWVKKIADLTGCDYGTGKKVRFGDMQVKIELPPISLGNKDVILIDDMVSTGYTLATAAQCLRDNGARSVDCIITHPLFTRGALTLLRKSGIRRVVSTDTVVHSTNRIFMAPILASGLAELL